MKRRLYPAPWWRQSPLDPARLWQAFCAIIGKHPPARGGRYVSMRCPLPGHDDHRPSFSLNLERGNWQCFACGRHGDLPALAMEMHGLSFRDAAKWLEGL